MRRSWARWARVVGVASLLAVAGCSSSGPEDGGVLTSSREAPSSAAPSPTASGSPTEPSRTPSPSPAPTEAASVRFSALGDIGSTDDAAAVLRSIAARDDDFTLALGDLSYGSDSGEDDWCRFVARRVGRSYPFQLVSGNHESNGVDGDIDDFVQCLPNRLPGLVGTYGRQWYVDRPAEDPLVRVVMVSPSLDFGRGPWSYDEGTAHHEWLRSAVAGARAAGIPWVVVGMHKPCLSMGKYSCDPGPEVVDLLLDSGVDLVLTGHEHLYQRTRPLALGAGCRGTTPGRYDADCVVADGGTTFVTVGTGGTRLRDVKRSDDERRYFAAVSGANAQPSHGSLDVLVTRERLTATFRAVGRGRFTDQLVLRR